VIKVTGLTSLIKKVERKQRTLPDKVREIATKLAEIGVSVARIGFSTAIYDGKNDVVVNDPQWISDNTLQIVSQGNAVAFIEFGSGVHYRNDKHPLESKFGLYRGMYGFGHGKNDFWYYEGEPGTNGVPLHGAWEGWYMTQGNPANRCLYNASKEMRQKILEVAQGVMKS